MQQSKELAIVELSEHTETSKTKEYTRPKTYEKFALLVINQWAPRHAHVSLQSGTVPSSEINSVRPINMTLNKCEAERGRRAVRRRLHNIAAYHRRHDNWECALPDTIQIRGVLLNGKTGSEWTEEEEKTATHQMHQNGIVVCKLWMLRPSGTFSLLHG